MSNNDFRKDRSIIHHILKYCQEADAAVDYFGNDESTFMNNPIYRNAVSMPIQQIGELAKHLSDDFINAHPDIPWRQIKGMRDWFAHQYLAMDADVIWTVSQTDLPPLKAFCEALLKE